MAPFWIALPFLSSLPVTLPGMPPPQALGRSLLCYPLVGLLFGALLWLLHLALGTTPAMLQAALLLSAWVFSAVPCTSMAWRTALTPGWVASVIAHAPWRS